MMDGWAKDALDRLLSMTAFFENDDDRLTINVSGTHYEINVSHLSNFPDTILGDSFKRARYLVPGTHDYFFPRHSTSFESILYYYINDGVLIKPETVPAMIFYEEIRFFQLNDRLIQTFYNDYLSMNEEQPNEYRSTWRHFLHQLLIHPPINSMNSIFGIFSAVFNALAIYSLCLETVSIYRQQSSTVWMVTHPLKMINRTNTSQCSQMSRRPYHYLPSFNSENSILELICLTWFYVELFVRTLAATSARSLLNDPNFTLDILSIAPTFVSQIFYRFYFPQRTRASDRTLNETHLFDYFTCLKLFRLFRLIRHGKSLATFFKVLYLNCKHLLMLTVLILFGTFYFGLTQFVLEQMSQGNEITSISEALWHVRSQFGFTVIITVGYSDITEYQFLSYSLAIIGVWYGSISMAIILPNLTQTFNIFHNFRYRRNRIQYRIN